MKKSLLLGILLSGIINFVPSKINTQERDYGIKKIEMCALEEGIELDVDIKSKEQVGTGKNDYVYLAVLEISRDKKDTTENLLDYQYTTVIPDLSPLWYFYYSDDRTLGPNLKDLEGKLFVIKQYDECIPKKNSDGMIEYYPGGQLLDKKIGQFPDYNSFKYLKKCE